MLFPNSEKVLSLPAGLDAQAAAHHCNTALLALGFAHRELVPASLEIGSVGTSLSCNQHPINLHTPQTR
jgi:hypothetical protein